jgi:hypothetical protein
LRERASSVAARTLARIARAGIVRACIAVPIFLPVAVAAQVNATSDYLARMDSDRDGRVGPSEFLDWMSYAFDARDGNRDGVLSADELPGGRGQSITRDQHRERLVATFKKQDTNRDGYLSARELAAPPQ